MSWDGYIAHIVGTEQSPIEEAAIWGQEPLSEWAATPGFKGLIKAEELKVLCGDRTSLPIKGMTIAGMKCVFLKDEMDTEHNFTLNLKTRADESEKKYCISIGKTLQTFIIAKGFETAQGGQVPNKLYKTIDYLRRSGY